MDAADAVLRFIEGTGRPNEAEFYLRLFRAEAKERFATIAVGAQVARNALDAVVVDLRFLATLGLVPVVVLGLIDAGEADERAGRIRRRLEKAGVPAQVISDDESDLTTRLAESARAGIIPIVPLDDSDGSTIEQRYDRLADLLATLQSRKLIMLSTRGGLRLAGRRVELINLSTDFDALVANKDLSPRQRSMLANLRRVALERLSHRITFSLTSPLDLLRELFTARGAGTMIRRGAVVIRCGSFDDVDLPRLRELLESGFGHPTVPEFFARPVAQIYREEGYRAAAIVADTPLGAYLSKFVVEREAQGEGLGRDVWRELVADYPVLFWRSRSDNPINSWYIGECDGMSRTPEWQVFWRGLPPERIAEAIAYACAAPRDIDRMSSSG